MRIDYKNPENWIPRDLFQSYCGEKSERLISFYDKAVEKRKMQIVSINWLALFLFPAWLGYRKQWSILIALTAIFSVLPFLEGMFSFKLPTPGFAGGLLAVGLLANSFLLMNAQKDFSRLKQSGMDNDAIKNQLENKASPSVKTAVLSLFGYLVITFFAAIIADVIYGLPNY